MLQKYLNILKNCNNKGPFLSIVRFNRKPRWMPTAPSKLFRIPARVQNPPEEELEWKRININYKTQINSLRGFLIQENREKKKREDWTLHRADEQDEFQRCLDLNDKWNNEISIAREARILKQNERSREKILQNLDRAEIRSKDLKESIEKKVHVEMENSKTFITEENLQQYIEQALANPVSFNYSIDQQGNTSNKTTTEE